MNEVVRKCLASLSMGDQFQLGVHMGVISPPHRDIDASDLIDKLEPQFTDCTAILSALDEMTSYQKEPTSEIHNIIKGEYKILKLDVGYMLSEKTANSWRTSVILNDDNLLSSLSYKLKHMLQIMHKQDKEYTIRILIDKEMKE